MTDASPTPLERVIAERIRVEGPISVETYMALCLGHPEHGYYRNGRPIGAEGDFVTAPEVSQIFGELCGLWLAQSWLDQGAPSRFLLVELGPGRGVLMQDALRAARAAPGFLDAAELWLVEGSEVLRAEQTSRLGPAGPHFALDLSELPEAPLFLIANEFFDALPVRQLKREGGVWRERWVTLQDGRLAFDLGDGVDERTDAPEGAWLEISSAGRSVAAAIGVRLARHGGAALMIDYGYDDAMRAQAGWPETLQALRRHAYADPLSRPGEIDLTTHVSFGDLARALAPAPSFGLTSQGALLRRLGAETRAAMLARSSPDRAEEIAAGLHRLTHPNEMGRLFRALAATGPGAPTPPGFEADVGALS